MARNFRYNVENDITEMKTFEKQQFISIESFRKNGEGVKTPVWFVQEGETLYAWTEMDSWKVKRIRRNPRVRIAPCKYSGELLGEQVEAVGAVDDSGEAQAHLVDLMSKKYGLQFRFLRWLNMRRGGKYTALSIRPAEPA